MKMTLKKKTPGKDFHDTPSPGERVIAGYLEGFKPQDDNSDGKLIARTTDDIIADLGAMAELTQSEVNAAMVERGYRCGYDAFGVFGWLMTAKR